MFPAARAVTHGPKHHFFGYYDKFPWDVSGRYLLAMETSFIDRAPEAEDATTLGLIDLQEDCAFTPIASTRAWNWQQGTMLQWVPGRDHTAIFNVEQEGEYRAVLLDVRSGEPRVLPRPIYTLARDGRRALSTNFSRLHRLRPGYGYAGVVDPYEREPHPAQDGIYVMDLETGENRLIISYDQIAHWDRQGEMEGQQHWFNHLQISTDDSRFAFLHRWQHPEARWHTRLFTANFDGTEIRCLSDHELVSHYDWRDESHVLAWARRHDRGDHFYLFGDGDGTVELEGEGTLWTDGHCSYSPSRRWVLTDTYPDEGHMRTLLLYDPAANRHVPLGRFLSPPALTGAFRCDLHPRWSRDGRQVCFDSVHTGERQMYVVDVADIVG
jgi:hypothetical protein